MDIQKYLEEFAKVKCSCGKEHNFNVKKIIVKKGAINKIPALLLEFNAKKPFIIADKNTYSACGERLVKILEDNAIKYSKYVYPFCEIEPDERAVGSAIMHFDSSCDLVIAVGSGVINDIGKILSSVSKNPYFIVGTAPSMDGYASATSSMAMDGVKVSLNSKCAEVIIGDIDVLKNAPLKMLKSGVGDMLAKYVSIAEWRISNEINGEYYCERVASLIRKAVKEIVDNADKLLKRDEKAVQSVFEGLILGGVAMAFAGVSRPASGVEHYISHLLDMRALEFNAKAELHGIQCAIGTNIASELYEKVLKVTPDREKAIYFVKSYSYDEHKKELKALLGRSADTMISLEEKEQKYDKVKHEKRLEVIINKWDKIKEIIIEEIPSKKEIERILDSIKAPKTLNEIGVNLDLLSIIKATKDIRDKYVLSCLLWDLGVINEI